MRQCAGCGRRRPKAELVRLAVANDAIVVDRAARMPGRGAYLCPDRNCLRQALKRASLLHRLRVPGSVAAGLEERLALEGEPGVWEN